MPFVESHKGWKHCGNCHYSTWYYCTCCNGYACKDCQDTHQCKPKEEPEPEPKEEPEPELKDYAAEYLQRMMLDFSAHKGKHKELTMEHEELKGEFDALRKARDNLAAEHHRMFKERNEFANERDELVQKCDDLVKERDDLATYRDRLLEERREWEKIAGKRWARVLELAEQNDELRQKICDCQNLAQKIVDK